jgi:ribonuclease HI
MKHIKKAIIAGSSWIVIGDSKKIIEEMNEHVLSKETLEEWKEQTKIFKKK